MQKGFTLMELMVALAVSGILVSLALETYVTFHRDYSRSVAAYESVSSEKILLMQKGIRELRECQDAKRL